jgi:sugar phosphate isomerase/epimerase
VNDPWAGFLISSAAWQGRSHGEAIAAVRAAGFGGVEILCKPGHFEHDNPAHVDEVRSTLAEWPDAMVTFHAPFHTADLGSADAAVWDYGVGHVAQSLRVASSFRAGNATLHARIHGEARNWNSENLAAFQRALDFLTPVAAECNMTLAVENSTRPRLMQEAEHLLSLLDMHRADLVGACLDTGHAHLAGAVVEIAGMLAPRAFVVHFHDNHAEGEDEHSFPGQGTIPWGELVEALQSHGFRGHCVLEVVAKENLPLALNSMKDAIVRTGLNALTGVRPSER